MNEVLILLCANLYKSLTAFLNPHSRLYWPYLLICLPFALFFLSRLKRFRRFKDPEFGGPLSAWKIIFAPGAWWNRSGRLDLFLFFFNPLLLTILLFVLTGSGVLQHRKIASGLAAFLIQIFDFSPRLEFSPVAITLVYTASLALAGDFSRYLLHRAMHEIPLLWEFHKVHHSAPRLTPLTLYRVHPLEKILFTLRDALVTGLVSGVFLFLFPTRLGLFAVLGVNVFRLVFHIGLANLRHSPIWFPFWHWLERVLISPAQHQIHHGNHPALYDKNYGSQFALWDWLGGSLVRSREVDPEKIRFGIAAGDMRTFRTLKGTLFAPFKNLRKNRGLD